MLMKDHATLMIVSISTIAFVLIGLIIGIIAFPVQTTVAFLDAPIPPTTSSNSTVSNSTIPNSTT